MTETPTVYRSRPAGAAHHTPAHPSRPVDSMSAAVLTGPGEVEVRRLPVPELQPDHALVRVARVGLCGTDLELLHGTASYVTDGRIRLPWIFGHEWTGTVQALGPGTEGPQPGTRVVGQTMVPCELCPTCRRGRRSLCPWMREIGLYGLAGAAAEYIQVPVRALVPVPDKLDDTAAAMVEPAVTVVRALRDTDCSLEDDVAVVGTGTIGLLAIQLAARTAGGVTAVGVDPAGMALAGQLGADAVHHSGAATPASYPLVVEASGTAAGFREALRLVATGGRIAAVGVADRDVDGFPAAEVTLRGIAIHGIRHGLDLYDHTMALFTGGLLDAAPLVHQVYPLREVGAAFHALEHERAGRPKVALDLTLS